MTSDPRPPGFLVHVKWSLAMLAASLTVGALAVPVLRLLGFMD